MNITVKLYGNLKKYSPHREERASLELENGLSIRTLLSRLGVPDADVWMCAVNDTVVDDLAQLQEGDMLEVFEPVGGGSRT
jgi:sulfur carrier protein ThiS